MLCNYCGNNIPEGSFVCPVCGAQLNQPVQNNPVGQNYNQQYQQPYNQQYNQPYGQPYNQAYNPYSATPGVSQNTYLVNEFYRQAKSLRNYGIAAAILMFGIGFIFSIIIVVKGRKLQEPVLYNPTPVELADLESGRKALKTANILALLPAIALGLSFIVGFIQGLTGAM